MAAQGQGQPQGHFDQFISLMNHEQAKDLVRNINLFMKSFKQSAPDADTDSRAVQGFLQQMETAMAKHPLFADTTPQEQDAATEALEKYLMTKLHERTFRQGSDDVERDEFLAVRCAALQFVRPEHLEIPAGVVDSDHLGRAVEELNKINKYKAPRDKLVCVLNCCSMINAQLAKNSKAEGIGADDFTPMLIYVVIKARTSFLASNLAYIERYRYHPKLTAEAQYYYIQLCGAATFIEMINAQSLKVDRDEFIAHMLAAGAMTDEQLASLQSNKSADMAAAAAVVSGPAAAAVGSGSGSGTQQSIHQSTQAAVAAATAAGIRPNDWQFNAQQQQQPQQFPLQMQALPPVNSPAGGWPQTAAGHSHTGLAYQQQQQQYSQPLQQQLLLLPRITDLESQGAALLSQRDPAASARQLVSRHPFCCSNLDSLSLGDVGQLLSAYKELVLRYEALTAALQDFSQQQQQQQQQQQGTASAAAAAGPLPPATSAAGVAGDALTPPASTGGAGEAVMLPPLSPGSAAAAAPQPTMSPAAAAAEQQQQQDPTLPADSSSRVALQQPADTANDTGADPTTTATGSSQTAAEAVAVLTTPAAASAAVLSPPPPPAIAEAAAGAGAEATPAAGAANREPSLAPIRSSSNASAASAQAAVLAAAVANATELAVSSVAAQQQQQQQQQQSNVDDLLHSLLSPSAAAGGAPAGVPANTTEASAAIEQQQQQQPQQATAVEDEDLFGIFQRPSPAGGSATNDSTAAAAAPSLLD